LERIKNFAPLESTTEISRNNDARVIRGSAKNCSHVTTFGVAIASPKVVEMLDLCNRSVVSVLLVPEAGIEPACAFWARGILSPLRLPISPLRQRGPQWRDSSIGV